LRGAAGERDVDVSAALLTEGDQESFGFTVRVCAEPKAAGLQSARRTDLLRSLTAIEADLGTEGGAGLLSRGRLLLHGYLAEIALERSRGDTRRAAALLGFSDDEFARLRSETNPTATPLGDADPHIG
jgi:hypothetical protein